ncbi:MAG: substrate-binding domain-containing protein [Eubacterium sp.]|nr:substrate-binding domain-containing protein [Eubacterium sp.]
MSKKVTIQAIAEKAGVSRGTVDRAIHQRGRISPEAALKIRKIADEMGYVPKGERDTSYGKQEQGADKKQSRRRTVKIGIVTQLAKSSFMLEVNRGIRDAAAELKERGVMLLLEERFSVDEEEQLAAIDHLLEQGIDGLALMPVDSERIRQKINVLIEEKQIPVVTFNSDIVGTGRICYVGMDNRKSGQTAAGLMGLMTRGIGKILVITGYFSSHVDNMRVDGFVEELKAGFPDLELAGVQRGSGQAQEVERIIVNTMLGMQGIAGIVVVSGGQAGIRAAFESLQLDRRPYVIIYDLTPRNEKILQDGIADFLIDQEGYVQGYRPPYILADLLQKGHGPKEEYIYTDIHIKTKYNLKKTVS